MIKGCAVLIVGFFLLLSIPVCVGIGGGIFGIVVGLIGGTIGLVVGILGTVIGAVAQIFSGIIQLLFGGGHDHGFHPWHWHVNGFVILSVIVLIVVLAMRSKK